MPRGSQGIGPGVFDPNALNDRARNSRWNTNKGFVPNIPPMFPPFNFNNAQGNALDVVIIVLLSSKPLICEFLAC